MILASFPNALLLVREGADLCVANTTYTTVLVKRIALYAECLCIAELCLFCNTTQHKNWELGIMA